jgi:hypothetical protein
VLYPRLSALAKLKLTLIVVVVSTPSVTWSTAVELAANIPASSIGYPFGVIRSQGSFSFFSKARPIYWSFDTDALYTNIRLKKWLLLEQKIHFFDYQNLNHVFEPATLTEQKSLSYMATSFEPSLRVIFRKKQFFFQASFSTLLFRLQQREAPKASFTGFAPGIGLIAGMTFFRSKKPSSKVFLKTDSKYYDRGADSNILRRNTVHRIHIQGEHQFFLGWLQPGITVKAVNILNESGKPVHDTLVMDSVGGPEYLYNRLIGFPFSVFRSPHYFIISIKIPVLMLKRWRSEFLFDRGYLNSQITPIADGVGLHTSYKTNWGKLFVQLGRTLYPSLENWQFYGGLKTFL